MNAQEFRKRISQTHLLSPLLADTLFKLYVMAAVPCDEMDAGAVFRLRRELSDRGVKVLTRWRVGYYIPTTRLPYSGRLRPKQRDNGGGGLSGPPFLLYRPQAARS